MQYTLRTLLLIISVIFCLAVIITCIKVEKKVMVSTGSITEVQRNSAMAEGTIVDIGDGISDHGHVYGTSSGVTFGGSNITTNNGSKGSTGSYMSQLTNLTAGTTYYVRAYIIGSSGTVLGKEVSFKTENPVVPTLTTSNISTITTTTAASGGDITADGGSPVSARGVCWSISTGPTVSDSKTTDGSGIGSFSSEVSGLMPSTQYYLRAYATNAAGTGYGSEIQFNTQDVVVPTVITIAATDLTTTSATCRGNVTSDGGAGLTNKGICWSTSPNPTIFDQLTYEGSFIGEFASLVYDLSPGTIYHFRAYATNSAGTAYGEDLTFTTQAGLPTVSTNTVTNIASTTATSGGNITSNGGSPVTERGVCWSTSYYPTTLDSKSSDGTGIGSFTSSMSGLSPSTVYHVRAYATNSAGTAYGDDVSFTSSNPVYAPLVLTATAYSITTTTAISGGNVQDGGGSTVESKGVCWSTSPNPTISDQKTNEGAGLGAFTSNLTGLSPATTYHMRAYGTNAAGLTGYGSDVTFTTNAVVLPVVTTQVASGIASTGVYSGGEVTNEGTASVTLRGVCYGLATAPTITGSKVDAGSGAGVFTVNLKSLSPNTLYYARAFATSSEGTSYGNEVSFTTTIQVTDIEGNVYNTVKVGSQLWMQENLKATKFRDGTNISNIVDNTAWSTQTAGALCWYDNDMAGNKNTYGALYNYFTTISNLNLCPTGWRVPTDADWSVLETFLDGPAYAGGKLKETGTVHWTSPNYGATNEAGFTALPGGLRMSDGTYASKTTNGYWWHSTEATTTTANRRDIAYNTINFYASTVSKNYGFSVRCLQGEGKVLPTVTTKAITNLSATGASSGGDISSDGGAAISARGVCWSTSPGPTIPIITMTSDGTGAGSYPSNISGLTANTTYYVRAYATNSVGTSYGNEVTFSTSTVPDAPVIGNATAGDAQATVTFTAPANDGGSAITGYTVTSNPGGITGTGTTSPVIVTGLTNLTAYTFTVVATNINGNSASSAGSNSVIPGTVTNLTTGRIWMDRNLGASQVAASSTDAASYGDLYQWGREADGHQIRTSGTTNTLSGTDTPGHGNFILTSAAPNDWRNPQNNGLWQGVSGINNPCPTGFRIPTKAEFDAEIASWSSQNAAGAFASPLKLPAAGYRHWGINSIDNVGTEGGYYTSTVTGTDVNKLNFGSTWAATGGYYRAMGFSIRCIKD